MRKKDFLKLYERLSSIFT